MAKVTVSGTDECVRAFKALAYKMREQGLKNATDDGAQVAKAALEAAAPVGHYPKGRKAGKPGPIKSNIIIYARRRIEEEKGDYMSELVGPSKSASFYAYFIEKGWYPAGRRITWYAAKGRWLPAWKATRRRLRISGQQAAHSQMGSLPSRFILGTHWAEDAYKGCADRITRAMKAAFERIVSTG